MYERCSQLCYNPLELAEITKGTMKKQNKNSQPGTPGIPKLALSRHEAANALGLSAVTIDRLTERGLLKPSRATRRPLYPVVEIERFLKDTAGKAAK